MKAMSCLGLAMALLVPTSVEIFAQEASNTGGQFVYKARPVILLPHPAGGGWYQAVVPFEVINNGDRPLHIALFGKPTLQLDDGTIFSDRMTVSGVSLCQYARLDHCASESKSYVIAVPKQRIIGSIMTETGIAPRTLGRVVEARLSGQLYVRDPDSQRQWIDVFAIDVIPVKPN